MARANLHSRQPAPAALAEQVTLLTAPENDLAARLRLVDELTTRLAEHPDRLRTALSAHLAGQPGTVLLFVDQFEEIFTACQEGTERCRSQAEQFIALLADAVTRGDGRIRLLVTLRADFLNTCLSFSELRDLLQDHQFLLGPLDEAGLREAIVLPAQAVGAFFEKGLVNTILRDVAAEPGALPLLQHALYELWLARRGPWLTLDAYEASGGVRGALQRRAQATFDSVDAGAANHRTHDLFAPDQPWRGRGRHPAVASSAASCYPVGVQLDDVNQVLAALSAPKYA